MAYYILQLYREQIRRRTRRGCRTDTKLLLLIMIFSISMPCHSSPWSLPSCSSTIFALSFKCSFSSILSITHELSYKHTHSAHIHMSHSIKFSLALHEAPSNHGGLIEVPKKHENINKENKKTQLELVSFSRNSGNV